MATYTTVSGDTWDNISYKCYGSESYIRELMQANMPFIDITIFSAGIDIDIPLISETENTSIPSWRTVDDE